MQGVSRGLPNLPICPPAVPGCQRFTKLCPACCGDTACQVANPTLTPAPEPAGVRVQDCEQQAAAGSGGAAGRRIAVHAQLAAARGNGVLCKLGEAG